MRDDGITSSIWWVLFPRNRLIIKMHLPCAKVSIRVVRLSSGMLGRGSPVGGSVGCPSWLSLKLSGSIAFSNEMTWITGSNFLILKTNFLMSRMVSH